MPKNTFNKLNDKKRAAIQNAFYKEFSLKLFHDASITKVVRQLGIAKGSMYQYFDNKIDLYIHLMMEAGTLKARFLDKIKRDAYPTFWAYITDIYKAGIKFDQNHFLESHFLYAALNNVDSPSIKKVFDQWNKAIHQEFTNKVQFEIDAGLFHNEIPPAQMAFILHHNLNGIHEYMKQYPKINIEKCIIESKGVYSGKREMELFKMLELHLIIMKKAFDK